MTVRVAILGAGGFARELRWAVDHGRTPDGESLQTVAFVELAPRTEPLKGLPVVSLDQLDDDTSLICGIGGMTEIKTRVIADALARGHRFAPPLVAAGAIIGPDVVLGTGSVVCAGAVVTADVTIGEHVAIHVNCAVGHDATIGDFATVSPGACVSGWVSVGRRAFLGTGAAVIEKVSLGDDSVLGAGAVAIRDVPARAVAVGVPAVVITVDRLAV
ncbi:acetyltransferase [Acidothermaceae bacterium B102]|nr:acetyltransferase [Acidothermaceae bacterium B102]